MTFDNFSLHLEDLKVVDDVVEVKKGLMIVWQYYQLFTAGCVGKT